MGRAFNPSEGEQGDFPLLPAGEYVAHCIKLERRQSENSDSGEYLFMRYQILTGQYKKRLIFDRLYLNEKSQWRVGQLSCAAGLTTQDAVEKACKEKGVHVAFDEDKMVKGEVFFFDSDDALTAAFCNRPLKIDVYVDGYKGKDRNKINKFRVLTDAEKSEALQAADSIGAGDDEEPKQAQAPAKDDDDCPF